MFFIITGILGASCLFIVGSGQHQIPDPSTRFAMNVPHINITSKEVNCLQSWKTKTSTFRRSRKKKNYQKRLRAKKNIIPERDTYIGGSTEVLQLLPRLPEMPRLSLPMKIYLAIHGSCLAPVRAVVYSFPR